MFYNCFHQPHISADFKVKVFNNLDITVIVFPRATGLFAAGCGQELNGLKHICVAPKAIAPRGENHFTFNTRAHCKNLAMELPDGSMRYYNLTDDDIAKAQSGAIFYTEFLLRDSQIENPITAIGTCLTTR